MKNMKYAYCNGCEDLVEYDKCDAVITENYKGENVHFEFEIGKCRCCGCEVATDLAYNERRSNAKITAYKKQKGLIDLAEISELLEKYDVGKETMASIAGFGKVTIKRYYEGFIPAKEYSDILVKLLNDEGYYWECVEKNKAKLTKTAYDKIVERFQRLMEIKESKTDQIINYIVVHLGEVTPLALEKMLYFANGVNYAMNGNQLVMESCQAWQHGPVYPVVYSKYKKYGYKPIDTGINSEHGCMLSLLSDKEIAAIDMAIRTFGMYSPRTLEMISHKQTPWLEKRCDCKEGEASNERMEEASVKEYYIKNELNTDEKIMQYIWRCMGQ